MKNSQNSIVNEEQYYLRLKESIRTKDSQLSPTEGDRLIEHGRRIGSMKYSNKMRGKI